jgi:hypothetical protein
MIAVTDIARIQFSFDNTKLNMEWLPIASLLPRVSPGGGGPGDDGFAASVSA